MTSELVLTPGSLGGIGYEIAWKFLQSKTLKNSLKNSMITVFGEPAEWAKTLRTFGELPASSAVHLEMSSHATHPAYHALQNAIHYVAEQPQSRALVNGPMRKSDFPEEGAGGHTETLRRAFKKKHVTMLFWAPELCLIPLTRHMALKEVPHALTRELYQNTFHDLLTHVWIWKRTSQKGLRILVTGLNPHAGENGTIGLEEKEWITETLQEFRREGWDLTGPVAADSAFTPERRAAFDLVLTCYHDQGLPAFKALYFSESVQLTLGLPIIRVSVDHGTAENLYLQGRADERGLVSAMTLAEQLLQQQRAGHAPT